MPTVTEIRPYVPLRYIVRTKILIYKRKIRRIFDMLDNLCNANKNRKTMERLAADLAYQGGVLANVRQELYSAYYLLDKAAPDAYTKKQLRLADSGLNKWLDGSVDYPDMVPRKGISNG